jgi:hypothetical protein
MSSKSLGGILEVGVGVGVGDGTRFQLVWGRDLFRHV